MRCPSAPGIPLRSLRFRVPLRFAKGDGRGALSKPPLIPPWSTRGRDGRGPLELQGGGFRKGLASQEEWDDGVGGFYSPSSMRMLAGISVSSATSYSS